MRKFVEKVNIQAIIFCIVAFLPCEGVTSDMKILPDSMKNIYSPIFANDGSIAAEISFDRLSRRSKKISVVSFNLAKEIIIHKLVLNIHTDKISLESISEIKDKYLSDMIRIEEFTLALFGEKTNVLLIAKEGIVYSQKDLKFKLKNVEVAIDKKTYKFDVAILSLNKYFIYLSTNKENLYLSKFNRK